MVLELYTLRWSGYGAVQYLCCVYLSWQVLSAVIVAMVSSLRIYVYRCIHACNLAIVSG